MKVFYEFRKLTLDIDNGLYLYSKLFMLFQIQQICAKSYTYCDEQFMEHSLL